MAEHLHYIEVLQPLHGFLKDVSHLELDVGIDPYDVLPIGDNAAQMFDAKPDCVLLHPEFLIRPQAKVERVIEVGNLKWPVAEGDLQSPTPRQDHACAQRSSCKGRLGGRSVTD
jgi:hypothetical protein